MAKKKDKEDPSSTSVEYDEMLPQWLKIDTLLGGTDVMRAAGQVYLPMHTEEEQSAYDERLIRSVLFNKTKITLNEMVGKPFSEPIQLNEDIPSQIVSWLEDVDLQGNKLDVFARNWFKNGLAKAYSHVLVDFPRILPRADGQARTLADDRRENIRPYWVHVLPENLIYARAEIQNGKEILQEVRIMETVTEQDGFIQVFKPRIRRILPGIVEFWVPTKQKKNNKPIWVKNEEFKFELDFVPLVTFYSDRQNFMTGTSMLNDLADMNIQHWQSLSDQINVLTVARFPILALSGAAPEEGKLKIGPRKWLHSPDPQSKYYYVENEGRAIEAGRKDLEDIEDRMSQFGSQLLRKRPGGVTATEKAIDSAEMTSPLEDTVIRFMDAVNLALEFTAKWAKVVEGGGTVTINREFGLEETSEGKLNTLSKTRQSRDISRKAYLTELKLQGVLSEDFDMEKDLEEMQKESMDVPDGTSKTDLDPGAPDTGDDDDDDDSDDKK